MHDLRAVHMGRARTVYVRNRPAIGMTNAWTIDMRESAVTVGMIRPVRMDTDEVGVTMGVPDAIDMSRSRDVGMQDRGCVCVATLGNIDVRNEGHVSVRDRGHICVRDERHIAMRNDRCIRMRNHRSIEVRNQRYIGMRNPSKESEDPLYILFVELLKCCCHIRQTWEWDGRL